MNKPVSSVKVLVVDDQPAIVEELCEFLQGNGFGCVPAFTSRQALEQFKQDLDIGLVLCDLHMPGLDGIELVQELKRVAGKHRPFEPIMMTGRADKQDVIKALREGFVDYYQKPVDLTELLEGLQRHEATLLERLKTHDPLGHLNEKLQYLADSIDNLYHDLDLVRRPAREPAQPAPAAESDSQTLPAAFNNLSPRQMAVAQLVGKGQTNYQIACELGITENTVKLYVSQVLRLTHMHNRTQLALALAPNQGGQRQRASAQ
ncbi:LuxR family transcriptional regulator [Pseudomonas sp. M47T1]|uniref:response regulator transcription factor n=1 Tax=Pseudomonas sp. M47T1 TaxID=1179778 RepID=UPI0002608800|nr:response regulator transcription factor [Pseudomonas sp. M47T1]EIK96549.1 LuxR family transcriptional regulator [Pseudomonas sp. M47T1]